MPNQPELRNVSADFNLLEERPGLGLSVLLGPEDALPELGNLVEGACVLLVEPGNLRAVGTVTSQEHHGRRYWYGLLSGPEAIEDIHPETLAGMESPDDSKNKAASA